MQTKNSFRSYLPSRRYYCAFVRISIGPLSWLRFVLSGFCFDYSIIFILKGFKYVIINCSTLKWQQVFHQHKNTEYVPCVRRVIFCIENRNQNSREINQNFAYKRVKSLCN